MRAGDRRRTSAGERARSGGASTPRAVTRCPGDSPLQLSAGASTTIRPAARQRAPATSPATTSARTTTDDVPFGEALRTGAGSSVSTTSTVAALCAVVAGRSGWAVTP